MRDECGGKRRKITRDCGGLDIVIACDIISTLENATFGRKKMQKDTGSASVISEVSSYISKSGKATFLQR